MKISNIKNYNIEKYVKLHLENLPNDFFSLLGEKLCKKYYEILLDIKNKPELFEIKMDNPGVCLFIPEGFAHGFKSLENLFIKSDMYFVFLKTVPGLT